MNYREILEDFVNNENTEYCYDWQGFDYETILPCIEKLLKNENNLQSKIDKAIEILESQLPICIMPNNMLIHGTEKAKAIEETLDVLKEEQPKETIELFEGTMDQLNDLSIFKEDK